MSVTEPAARTPLEGHERSPRGGGRAPGPRAGEDVAAFLASEARPGRGVIARGAGRSYGDAAQNAGGDVLDMTALDRIVSIDAERGAVTGAARAPAAQAVA